MYELLVDAEEHILSELKDGAKLSDVYNSTVAMVKTEKPEMVNLATVSLFLLSYHVLHFFQIVLIQNGQKSYKISKVAI
jgi:nucleosome binding factor SPN SPT16 subunit